MITSTTYSPHDLLPVPEPRTTSPTMTHFYNTVAKHLIKDTVRIMQNGLPIDLDKVAELEVELDSVIKTVHNTLASNPLIKSYQRVRYQKLVEDYKNEKRSKMKTYDHFLKEYKQGYMEHRSYVMNAYAQSKGMSPPQELLPTGIPKWTVADCRKYKDHVFVQKIIDKTINTKNAFVLEGMLKLANDKANIYNRTYKDAIEKPRLKLPPFNPGSSDQKRELFEHLGIESESTSKTTGNASWGRDEIERVNKQTADDNVRNLTQAMIDYSFGSIIKNNFIKAFYTFTINGRLYGQYKLFGAKSFRYTSKSPKILGFTSAMMYRKNSKRGNSLR